MFAATSPESPREETQLQVRLQESFLLACSDEKAEREIRDCKAELERQYGFNIQALAFPNGDYTEREVNLAQNAGYNCALTLDCGFNDKNTDPFRLRRVPLTDYASVSELLVKTSGLWGFLRLLQGTQSRFVFRRRKSCEGIERCLTLEKESLREVLYLDVSRSLQSTRTSSGVIHSTICS